MNSIFTDQEHRILLSAISRERKVCEECDKEIEDNDGYMLVPIVDSIERKVYEIQHYPQIAEKLKRSAMAVRGKYERLQNPNYMRRYNRGRSKDYDYVGIRDVSPAQIRKDMAAMKNNRFIEVDELPREEMMI